MRRIYLIIAVLASIFAMTSCDIGSKQETWVVIDDDGEVVFEEDEIDISDHYHYR